MARAGLALVFVGLFAPGCGDPAPDATSDGGVAPAADARHQDPAETVPPLVLRWSEDIGWIRGDPMVFDVDGRLTVGASRTSAPTPDVNPLPYLRQFAPDGTFLWNRTDRTTDPLPTWVDLASSPDGEIVAAGGSLIRKLTSSGARLWTRREETWDVAVDGAGNVIAFGGTVEEGSVLRKLTPDGNLLWERAEAVTAYEEELEADAAGDIVTAIRFPDPGDGGRVDKRDPDGELLWSLSLNDLPDSGGDRVRLTSLSCDPGGAVLVTTADALYLISPDGDVAWWTDPAADLPWLVDTYGRYITFGLAAVGGGAFAEDGSVVVALEVAATVEPPDENADRTAAILLVHYAADGERLAMGVHEPEADFRALVDLAVWRGRVVVAAEYHERPEPQIAAMLLALDLPNPE